MAVKRILYLLYLKIVFWHNMLSSIYIAHGCQGEGLPQAVLVCYNFNYNQFT